MAGSAHDPTAQSFPSTQVSQPGQSPPPYEADETRTVTGAGADPAAYPPQPGAPGLPQAGAPGWADEVTGSAAHAGQVVRYGPGVPAPRPDGQGAATAEQVWRTGLPDAARRSRPLRRLAGAALSVALLAASGAVIYLRLHHGPFLVTGVAITAQVRHGCTEDVTGRVGTTGAAGTVSYQWVFAPQAAAPQPLSQPVASGQTALYVTAAVEGQGHGSLTQTVTLQVLEPGHGSASAHVVLSC